MKSNSPTPERNSIRTSSDEGGYTLSSLITKSQRKS